MIAIVDYGMGNIASVANALEYLHFDFNISREREVIEKSTHIILPGVGSFREGMNQLSKYGLKETLSREVLGNKKFFLGICLGMQLLAEMGEEGGKTDGLGWIGGTVSRFKSEDKNLRIPHVGWNDIIPKADNKLFVDTAPNTFYFVHSYIFRTKEKKNMAAVCTYGEDFTAAVEEDNIFGVQFHPERSQKSGLTLLKNFYKLQ